MKSKTTGKKVKHNQVLSVFCLAASLLALSPAYAAISDRVTIEGEVGNIGDKAITLKTTTGSVMIPRSFFEDQKIEARPGKWVVVKVSLSSVVDYNKKYNLADKAKK